MLTSDCWLSGCKCAAVFHTKFKLCASGKYDSPLPPLTDHSHRSLTTPTAHWPLSPLTNHQITIIKPAMAGNLIYISGSSHKNIAKAFLVIIANHNWCICFYLTIIFQFPCMTSSSHMTGDKLFNFHRAYLSCHASPTSLYTCMKQYDLKI